MRWPPEGGNQGFRQTSFPPPPHIFPADPVSLSPEQAGNESDKYSLYLIRGTVGLFFRATVGVEPQAGASRLPLLPGALDFIL